MKLHLLSTRFPYAITEQVAKNKVSILIDLTSPVCSYWDMLVKNGKATTAMIYDPHTEIKMKLVTYMDFTLQMSPRTFYYISAVIKPINIMDVVIILKDADGIFTFSR